MKKILISILSALVIAGPVSAATVDDLVGLGMKPELAEYVAGLSTVLSNAEWIKATDQAGTGTINMVKVDATDDLVVNADSGDLIKVSVATTPVAAVGAATPVAAFTPGAAANWVLNGKANFLDDVTSTSIISGGFLIGTPVSGVTPRAGAGSISGQLDLAGKLNSSSYFQGVGLFIGTPATGVTPAAGAGSLNSLTVTGTSNLGDAVFAAAKQVQQLPAILTPATDMTPIAAGTMRGFYSRAVSGSPTRAAVFLPAATPNTGKMFYFQNEGSNPVEVYPSGTDKVNAGGAGTPVAVAAGKLEKCVALKTDTYTCTLEN